MKSIRYTKYIGDLASEVDMESLLQALSEYLLDSGFRDPYAQYQELDHNLDDLREALRRILQSGDFLNQEMQQQIDQMAADGTLDEFIDKLIERMQQENYISYMRQQGETAMGQPGGQVGDVQGEVRFDVTDKSLDFLGYKALRDLLGSLGKSSFGLHDTRHWATGIEGSGGSQR
jgi:Ca-activated chloride channel family protein